MIKASTEQILKYLRKTVIIGILCLFTQNIVYSQSTEPVELSNNSIYFDMGVGLVSQISINYELKFHSGEKISWFGRVGIGEAGTIGDTSGGKGGGIGAITMLTGKKNSHFELNAGLFVVQDGGYLLLDIGYRFQKPEGGFIFKTHLGSLGAGIGLGFAF